MRTEAQFWAKVHKTSEAGCWLWEGYLNQDGYGRDLWRGTSRYVHQVAYELEVGPIPEGLQLDHLCRVRRCVNPDHLEPVTARQNIMRGDTVAARNAAKTHCHRGHLLDEANTILLSRGRGRNCRICQRFFQRLYDHRKRTPGWRVGGELVPAEMVAEFTAPITIIESDEVDEPLVAVQMSTWRREIAPLLDEGA